MAAETRLDIRAYRAADLGAVLELWEACGLLRPWNDPRADIELCLRSPASGLFVATAPENDGREGLAATLMAGSDGHRGWLYYLAVAPRLRRRGHGAAMVRHAERWLAARGVRKIQLMVREENGAAQGFYERLAYRTEPRLVMARWLDH